MTWYDGGGSGSPENCKRHLAISSASKAQQSIKVAAEDVGAAAAATQGQRQQQQRPTAR